MLCRKEAALPLRGRLIISFGYRRSRQKIPAATEDDKFDALGISAPPTRSERPECPAPMPPEFRVEHIHKDCLNADGPPCFSPSAILCL